MTLKICICIKRIWGFVAASERWLHWYLLDMTQMGGWSKMPRRWFWHSDCIPSDDWCIRSSILINLWISTEYYAWVSSQLLTKKFWNLIACLWQDSGKTMTSPVWRHLLSLSMDLTSSLWILVLLVELTGDLQLCGFVNRGSNSQLIPGWQFPLWFAFPYPVFSTCNNIIHGAW